jgi:hypothetical protein
MEKIKEALQRLRETKGLYHQWSLARGTSGVVVSGTSDLFMEHDGSYTVDSIAAAIDLYTESLKPKPRQIPEIVKDLVEYVGDGISLPHIRNSSRELKQSVDAYYPF